MTRMLSKIAIATAVVGLTGNPSYAADYTLNIPITIATLSPEAKSIFLLCRGKSATDLVVTNVAGREVMLAGSGFSGTIQIVLSTASANPPYPPPTRYECWINGISVTMGTANFSYVRQPAANVAAPGTPSGPQPAFSKFSKTAGAPAAAPNDFPLNPNATLTMVISGPLPPQ